MSDMKEVKKENKEVEDMPTRDRICLLLGLILLFLIGGFTIVITLLLQYH